MAPLSIIEKNAIVVKIQQQLSKTPYACSSLTHLTNGTTNFVFRGTLIQPLVQSHSTPDNQSSPIARSIIVKHATEFAALNRDLPIDASRSIVEGSMLDILNNLPSTNSMVKVPHLLYFDRETNTQVLEDIPNVVDLKTILMSPNANEVLTKPFATLVGRALGSWLRSFHSWTSKLPPANLGEEKLKIGTNEPMRDLKYRISYDCFIDVLKQFPGVIGKHQSVLEEVKASAANDFRRLPSEDQDEGWGTIHGDFWTGNVLLPETQQPQESPKLHIVDWEFAQFGHRAYDVGQMIADLYERKHFLDVEGALWGIDAFIDGYGAVSEDMAFRIAIHAGVHLVTWMKRGPPLHMRAAWATLERARAVVELGMNFVLKGWERDRGWFRGSILAGLFI